MKQNPHGREACIIGEVKAEPRGIVAMVTGFGGTRIVDMLAGERSFSRFEMTYLYGVIISLHSSIRSRTLAPSA